MKYDSYLLNDFFEELNKNGYNYCVMNNYHEMPYIIPTDVDFAVEYKLFNNLDNIIKKFSIKHNIVVTQKIWHGYNKCAYILSPISFDENFFRLQLDFFVDFSGRGYTNLIPINDMLKDKRIFKNFFIPAQKIELPFLFFRRIFKGDLNKDHLNELNTIKLELDKNNIDCLNEIFDDEIKTLIYKIIEKRDIKLFNNKLELLRKSMKNHSNNNTSFLYKFKYLSTQFIRAIIRTKTPIGFSTLIISNKTDYDNKVKNIYVEKLSGSFHGYFEIKIDEKLSYAKKLALILKILILKIKKNHVVVVSKNRDLSLDYTINMKDFNDINLHVSNALTLQSSKINTILNDYFSPTRGIN